MDCFNQLRSSGVLIHPSALPSDHGIGDFGKKTLQFIDMLAAGGQTLWQILPLGPIGFGESPYSPFSSFAGEELLIDLEQLQQWGLLSEEDVRNHPEFDSQWIDFDKVRSYKKPLILKACENFIENTPRELKAQWTAFKKENEYWLNDYALFMALRENFNFVAWNEGWDIDIMTRTPEAIKKWTTKLKKPISYIKATQFFFDIQWKAVKKYANQKCIRIIGDVPIFVASDSADVWSQKDQFLLDDRCQCTAVAGVPPDYFSPTGQRWGNPLYNWKVMEADGFTWWKKRIERTAQLVDIIRIDHFRGLRAFWKIPAKEKTAEKGKWVKAPGEKLFTMIKKELPYLEIIAEDLGLITEDVIALRKKFQLPGMKILQFAFEYNELGRFNSDHPFLPHNHEVDSVVYTGTHDNDTTIGWYQSLPGPIKDLVHHYYGINGCDIAWDMIRSASASHSRYCIFPMQDVLALESWARTNTPATVNDKNWRWRVHPNCDLVNPLHRLRELSVLYGRVPWALR